ncbi:MAG: aldo/keto reductase, partial [Lachnospiraceae bacterium]|nr:aldo/keto reductase [Lachnospiraceae bacterium]
MKTRQLGDLTVSEVGMGCMAFSHGYGKIPPEQYSIDAIRNAYRHGCTLFDTAEIYSPNLAGIGHNERIVGKALKDVRKGVALATKLFLDSSEARTEGSVYRAVRRHLEDSMDRLQTDMVDLYYLHRTNGGVRIEDVAEAMGMLIEEGMIRGWGLSQVDVD